jgi:curved DNA-binding protein CbpA
MELNIQKNNDHLHIKQEYQNIYEQRQHLINVPFLEKNKMNKPNSPIKNPTMDKKTKNNLNILNNDNPYKILGINEDISLRETTRIYRRLSKSVHPDKGGNAESFDRLTKAYLSILEIKKSEITEKKTHGDLKDEFKENNLDVQKQKYFTDGIGFNTTSFNTFFNENKLSDINDDGYSDWIKNNKIEDIKRKPISGKFNLEVFNNKFDVMKTEVSKVNNKIILNATPIPASLGTKMDVITLGSDKVSDFSNQNNVDNKGLNYTDYQLAMSDNLLIDKSLIKNIIPSYKDLEEIKSERDKIEYSLSNSEYNKYQKNIEKLKKDEQERLIRLQSRDKQIMERYQKINNLLTN